MDSHTSSPLDLLRPLVPPDHGVSAWPLASGWWLLLLLALLLVIAWLLLRPILSRRKLQRQRYQHAQLLLDAALLECRAMPDAALARQVYLQKSNEIFKRILHQHPGLSHFSQLGGKAWTDFLSHVNALAQVNTSSSDRIAALYGDRLYAAHCPDNIPLDELHLWSSNWITAVAKQARKLAISVGASP